MCDYLNPPYGGELVNLLATPNRSAQMHAASREWPSWDLSPRQLCDLELLLNGSFSPLRGFLSRGDYENVCGSMRLRNGLLWAIPIVLDVSEAFARTIGSGATVALRDAEGVMLAALHVDEVWQPDRMSEAEAVYATTSLGHPGVQYLLQRTHPWYVGGQVEGIRPPAHYDFRSLRFSPADLRAELAGWRHIVAYDTDRPMHRADRKMTLQAAKKIGAKLLIHPSVGMAEPGDVDYYVRVRCYQEILAKYPKDTAKLSLLPFATRWAGPREALCHASARKNYGCSHFIVCRDHSSPESGENGKPFYAPHSAQDLVKQHQAELGITPVTLDTQVYLPGQAAYFDDCEIPAGAKTQEISAAELRRRLAEGREIPTWFTFPEVARELQRSYPPRHRQGFTVFFTGLSGSGKSTIANVLRVKFLELGGRPVTLLDGDIVRKNLSSELGFSKEHRDINIRRIGYVASEITKNGGIAICAPIAPYDVVRKQVRAMIQSWGEFVLVHVSTPLEVCESRDRKGLYAKARAGLVKQFTGISDPYESPADADVVIDTTGLTPEEAAQEILLYLQKGGFVGVDSPEAVVPAPTAAT